MKKSNDIDMMDMLSMLEDLVEGEYNSKSGTAGNEISDKEYLAMAQSFEKNQKYEKALKYYGKLINNNDRDENVFTAVAKIYEKLGEIQKAREYYIKALEINPQNQQVVNKLAALDQKKLTTQDPNENIKKMEKRLKAIKNKRKDKSNKRNKKLEIALAKEKKALEAELEKSKKEEELFAQYKEKKRVLDSLNAIEIKAHKNLKNQKAVKEKTEMEALGVLKDQTDQMELMKKSEAKLEDFVKKRTAAPTKRRKKALIYYNEAQIYIEQNDFKRGIRSLEKALIADPEYAEAQDVLANMYYNVATDEIKNGRLKTGIEGLKKATKFKSNFKEAEQNLRYAYIKYGVQFGKENNHQKALEIYKKALQIKADIPLRKNITITLFKLANIEANKKKYKNAINYFEKALRMCPPDEVKIRESVKKNIIALKKKI